MFRFKKWSFLLVLLTTLFVACNKEEVDTPNLNTILQPTTSDAPEGQTVSTLTSIRALAAAAKSSNRSGNGPDEENPCGCYDVFEGIDFEVTDAEIEAAIDAALADLSEEELSRLFDPVCTPEGEIYESACIADCEGVTGYSICTDDELEDYLFGDFDCSDLDSLNFPMELELPDGTTVMVNNEEEFFEVMDQWYEAYEDEYGDWEECYTIVYPVTIAYPDGTTATYNNDEELDTGLEAWWEANEEEDAYPMPVFPVTIQLEDGETITLENEEQFIELEEACYGEYEDDLCFEFVFPMTINQPDSTVVTVNNEDELFDLIFMLLPEDIDEEEAEEQALSMILPFDITVENGTQQTISTIEAFYDVLDNCYDGYGFDRSSTEDSQVRLKNKKIKLGVR